MGYGFRRHLHDHMYPLHYSSDHRSRRRFALSSYKSIHDDLKFLVFQCYEHDQKASRLFTNFIIVNFNICNVLFLILRKFQCRNFEEYYPSRFGVVNSTIYPVIYKIIGYSTFILNFGVFFFFLSPAPFTIKICRYFTRHTPEKTDDNILENIEYLAQSKDNESFAKKFRNSMKDKSKD